MKIKTIGSNMKELETGKVSIMFSYETPVAGWDDEGAFKTATHYSATTTRHINKYLDGAPARSVEQSYINSIATS
tara:strand:- start:284 stop:508 length:225 start_codon:yes stop_codon:yes gene_type:complete